jgi:hypothetical protein
LPWTYLGVDLCMRGSGNYGCKVQLTVALLLGLAACSQAQSSGQAPDATIAGAIDSTTEPDTTDGPASFVPIHLLPQMLVPGAPDLTLNASASNIDTSALTINGATTPYFVQQGDYAVLFTGAFLVQSHVVIKGTLPLIVVARGQVTVAADIDLQATHKIPGPGATSTGPGAGSAGASVIPADLRLSSGGGGGSYGTLGAQGGSQNASSIPAGHGGALYGTSPDAPLIGGSSGGKGGFSTGGAGAGGAGGGALQISSAVSITIMAEINASGGGGTGGGVGSVGGGGGGAGGEILLESPMILISGTLVASGGGGGGGGSGDAGPVGTDGGDGLGSVPASGGTGGIPQGSDGGSGAAGITGAFTDAQPGDGFNSKGGGGGGGAGRIWLRYRAAMPPTVSGATITPPAGTDPTLP